MSGGGEYVWNLAALSTSNAGTDYDQLIVGGDVALGGSSTLTLDFSLLGAGEDPDGSNAFWDSSHSWKIIDTATNTGGTNFASITNPTGGSFSTSVGTGGDAGDIFLNYSVGGGGLPGDFNGDHVVDAADYTVWRDHLARETNPASTATATARMASMRMTIPCGRTTSAKRGAQARWLQTLPRCRSRLRC